VGEFDSGNYLYGEVIVRPEDSNYNFDPREITITDKTTGIQFQGN
jgi:hypothetical protein